MCTFITNTNYLSILFYPNQGQVLDEAYTRHRGMLTLILINITCYIIENSVVRLSTMGSVVRDPDSFSEGNGFSLVAATLSP